MDSPAASTPRSPEAEIGQQVEHLWEEQELDAHQKHSQLSPSEKLNSCFERLPVSSFPRASASQVIEVSSDSSLADVVETLSKYKIISAAVRRADASDDDSWMDRYLGIVEFPGIVVWLLHQSEIAASVGGNFLETLTSSDFYKNTKVQEIAGSFRWAPFLALQSSDSFLTMLLLLSKYRMKSLPVVDLGVAKIENIITQSAVVHMLAECVGLHWFESWGKKSLSELGLPAMNPSALLKVKEDDPVLKAFRVMREKGIGGIPVVDDSGSKVIGNISIRDVQYLLTAPEIYEDYRTITAKDFLTAVRAYLEKQEAASPLLHGVITCKSDNTLKDIILKLDTQKIQRIYVVDEEENLLGLVTLRDIISKLVYEPRDYFGDFFYGVVPLPENSSV